MRRAFWEPTAWLLLLSIGFGWAPARAADLVWEVENPFRFFRHGSSFAMHETAFKAARGDLASPMPADIVWRLERRLNDPDCRNSSTPDTCAATAGPRWDNSRLGWAARTIGAICYESEGKPRRYPTVCERRYSWGAAKEDYVLPEAHTVNIRLAPEHAAVAGDCAWTWQPRKAGGRTESRKQACKNPLVISRVPYALDATNSGVRVSVQLPDGRTFEDPNVVVQDLFLVALGDSFASGEGNPDRPVSFSASREMVYDPVNQREEELASRKPAQSNYNVASATDRFDPKSLPKRRLEDEERERIYRPTSPEFKKAFRERAARWVSADCHRTQYGYPFRVGLQLALEDRHRSVTLVSLTCSGSEITAGLFQEMSPREEGPKVRAQLDLLSDLICRGGAAARTRAATYTLPYFSPGSTSINMQQINKVWCPPEQRKRPIDFVMMSIGGNDIGFGAMAAYSMTESAGDIAPIATLIGHQVRFGPQIGRVYLESLDERMKALRDAFRDGFGIEPARVLQTAYEPIQFDETGALCGINPTLGLDVHQSLKLARDRLGETADFLKDFLARIDCITKRGPNCPANLATGNGTGFTLITEHLPAFSKRGVCARDPKRAEADGALMAMPRKSRITDEFKPYSPAHYLPYAHKWRLFRTPNDAFLTANSHHEGISSFDLMQPAYAALFSGAIHPTAEGHAIIADHVMRTMRRMVADRGVVEAAR